MKFNEDNIKLAKADPVLNEYMTQLEGESEKNTDAKNTEKKDNEYTTALIGIGQAGGNVANRATGYGLFTCAINTSKEDLAKIHTDIKYEYKNAAGSGKERKRSKDIFLSNINQFKDFFDSNFDGVKNVILVASAAGGTGGGSAPMIARFLKDNYPNKNIFMMIILGSIMEDIKSQENTASVIEELNKAEVNYLLFDNDLVKGDDAYNKIDDDIIDAAKFISRQYFIESSVSNIDEADMQKLYIENKRMLIVSGNFDTKVSNKIDINQQIIDTIENSSQVKEIANAMSYAIFLSEKASHKNSLNELDKEFRMLVDEYGEPYEIYKHFQEGPSSAPDFVITITGLSEAAERYSVVNERLEEFNQRLKATKSLNDVNKVHINARASSGVILPDEVEVEDTSIKTESLNMFM